MPIPNEEFLRKMMEDQDKHPVSPKLQKAFEGLGEWLGQKVKRLLDAEKSGRRYHVVFGTPVFEDGLGDGDFSEEEPPRREPMKCAWP
jgi:hypothetical protein